jgi:Tfp pilus assembly major pilin PilA
MIRRFLNYFNPVTPFNRFWHPPLPGAVSRLLWIELICCASLFVILASLAMNIYGDYLKMAKVTEAVLSSALGDLKTEVAVYYAHTGQWPENKEAAHAYSVYKGVDKRIYAYPHQVELENGAIHVKVASLAYKTISVRPAVPAEDPLGPVVWFAGPPLHNRRHAIAGVDRTELPSFLINPQLR